MHAYFHICCKVSALWILQRRNPIQGPALDLSLYDSPHLLSMFIFPMHNMFETSIQSYKMIGKPVGLAVIINISSVLGGRKLKGAEKDVKNMRHLWEKFNFKVDVTENMYKRVRKILLMLNC